MRYILLFIALILVAVSQSRAEVGTNKTESYILNTWRNYTKYYSEYSNYGIEFDRNSALNFLFDQESFFQRHSGDIELVLNIDRNCAISPSIGQIKDLQTLILVNQPYKNLGDEIYEVIIPLELLNLQHLRNLKVHGTLNLRLPPGINEDQIESGIEQVNMTFGWEQESISFLGNLSKMRQLILIWGFGGALPTGFDRLHNLRVLSVNANSEPLAIDDRICDFTQLERLALSTKLQSSLPSCLEHLTNLKIVTMASCRREALPDGTMIHFPVALAALPNLEELYLWDTGKIEMPKAQYGFHNLHTLLVSQYPNDDEYDLCFSVESDSHMSDDEWTWGAGLRLDSIANYPKLQTVILRTMNELDTTLVRNESGEYQYRYRHNPPLIPTGYNMPIHDLTVLAIRTFINLIDTAWKDGKLPDLNEISMWDRDDGALTTITVWQRPASLNTSGITLPKDDENWLLDKEWRELMPEL